MAAVCQGRRTAMRFMIMVRANAQSEAEPTPMASEALMAEMVAYHEELAKAGVLLDGSGCSRARRAGGSGMRAQADRHRRPVRGDQGADRGLHPDPGRLARRGPGMDAALPHPVRGAGGVRDRGPAALRARGFPAQRDPRPVQGARGGQAGLVATNPQRKVPCRSRSHEEVDADRRFGRVRSRNSPCWRFACRT